MLVTIFGTGYVGLVQAAVLAEAGHDVLCVDVDPAKIERLRAGEVPIYEPGLEQLVRQNSASGRLTFTTDAREGVGFAGVQFIAVGTPPDEDGSADLRYVLAVADTIAEHMEDGKIVIVKSTVPVGTSDKVRAQMERRLAARARGDLSFDVASNPEFLKEGSAVADCTRPDRIIIGTTSEETEAVLRELYAPFNRNHEKIILMDVRSAELTKYAANCMLATKISFMNEIANLADRLGADIEKVRHGIGSDPRIGYQFIYPGIGYGGSCFPKDVQALGRTAREVGYDFKIMEAVEKVNERQKGLLFEMITAHFGTDLTGKHFAIWGLAFKPNTDDMREAPSVVLVNLLLGAGASICAYDPVAMPEATRHHFGDRIDYSEKPMEALEGADALVLVTEWNEFRRPDFRRVKASLRSPVVFDGRNIYSRSVLEEAGFTYFGIGT